jgi:hypothetical protein
MFHKKNKTKIFSILHCSFENKLSKTIKFESLKAIIYNHKHSYFVSEKQTIWKKPDQ